MGLARCELPAARPGTTHPSSIPDGSNVGRAKEQTSLMGGPTYEFFWLAENG